MKVKVWLFAGLIAGLASRPGGAQKVLAWQAGSQQVSPAPSSSGVSPADGSQANPAPAAPAGMKPHDVQVLLYKIYGAAYQFGNAGAALHPEEWKTSARKRGIFYQQLNSVRGTVDALQKPWSGFYKDPGDAALGRQTLEALKKLAPEADTFAQILVDAAGAPVAATYQKSAAELKELEGQLEPYVVGLEAQAKSESALPPHETNAKATAEAAPSPSAAPAQPSAATQSAQPSPAQNQPSQAAPVQAPAAPSAAAETAVPPATAQPAPAPVAMSATEVQALLYKIYAAGYRVTDLTGALPLDQWKLSDQERTTLREKADSLRTALTAEEKERREFYNHPDDLGLGQATVSALGSVSVRLDDFEAALEASPGAPATSDYRQSATELMALTHQIEPYIAYLEGKASAGSGALETEVVHPAEASAPLTATSVEKPPLDTDQVQAVLYKAYVPAFRLKDLLSQERPETWKAPDAQRSAFRDASQALGERLAELEKWRSQFEAHPESLEAAFEVYASLGKLTDPANTVGHLVSEFENPKEGDEYLNRAQQLADFRDQIEPYLGYLLGRYDHQTGTVERNFKACESELSYAMRPNRPAAIPMRNVNPVFQGHPRTRRVSHTEKSGGARPEVKKANHPKKSAKAATPRKPKQ